MDSQPEANGRVTATNPRRDFLRAAAAPLGSLFLGACGGGVPASVTSGSLATPVGAAPVTLGAFAVAPVPAPAPPAPMRVPPASLPAPVPPSLPSALQPFVPAPGQTANVNLNNLSAVNACPGNACWYSQASKQEAPWRNWTGAAWAPGFSPHGALIYWGGGHGGGEDISLYVFDFTTGLWSRIGPDNPSTSDYTTQLTADWYDYAYQGSYIVPALHTYNYPAYVPPNVSGSGPKGSWLMPQLIGGQGSGAQPHAVDLATGQWSRFATAAGVTAQSPYAGSFEDSRRNRVWWAAMEMPSMNMLDMTESHPRTIHVTPLLPSGTAYAFGGYYARHIYVAETDMVVGFWCPYNDTRVRGEVYDMSSGQPVRFAGNTWPEMHLSASGFGVDWCRDTQRFYFYEGSGATRVLTLTPSSLEFGECTWAWGQETFNNPAFEVGASVQQGGQPMSRWRYIPWLRCFGWSDGPNFSAQCADGIQRDGIMQLWRPLGT